MDSLASARSELRVSARIVVQKYGGSSLATSALMRRVARRVADSSRDRGKIVVVVSAPGDTTDHLVQRAEDVSAHPPPREMDRLLATGEQMSAALLSMALRSLDVPAVSFTGPEAGIVTDSQHTEARVLRVETGALRAALGRGELPVITGFQGHDVQGNVTTLGRGGSDLSAVAVAAALRADACEIFTDVEGVYTADPRVVADARKLADLNYEELAELTSLGAGVVHDRAVLYAAKYRVPLHVRSTFSLAEGTHIGEDATMEKAVVRAIALDPDIARIGVLGVPKKTGVEAKIFRALADAGVLVDLIVTNRSTISHNDVNFTVAKKALPKALAVARDVARELKAHKAHAERDVAKLSIVGIGIRTHGGVAATFLETLASENIPVGMLSTSEIKISAVIPQKDADRAMRAAHKAFQLDRA